MTAISQFINKNAEKCKFILVFHDDIHLPHMFFGKTDISMFGKTHIYPNKFIGVIHLYYGIYFGGVLVGVKKKPEPKGILHLSHIISKPCEVSKNVVMYYHSAYDFPIYLRTKSDDVNRDYWKLQDEPKLLKFWKTDLDIIYR